MSEAGLQAIECVQIFMAEFLASAILLFVGCSPFAYVMPITFGLAVVAIIQTFASISGCHANPGLTLAAFIMGQLRHPCLLIFYFVAEFVGAFVGYSLHWELVLKSFPGSEAQCLTKPGAHLQIYQGVLLEIVCTLIFTMASCAAWDKKNQQVADLASLKVGFILTGILFAMQNVIPISMNTARSLPPAIYNQDFQHHWIYWIAPNVGAVLAAITYRFVFYPRPWNN